MSTTAETDTDLSAGRRRVARSRGVLSGVLLVLLGAWAALVPFIGPYFDFGFQPRPDDAWHWTSGRGLYEVLPGGVAVLAGLVLLFSASRVLTLLFAALAAAAGAWLVVAPSLAPTIGVDIGAPGNPASRNNVLAETLLYFFATGVAIAIIGGIALGRLSTHSVRDVRAAERRAEAEAAEQHRLEQERAEHDRLEQDRIAAAMHAEQQRRYDDERRAGDQGPRPAGNADDRTATLPVVGDPHDTHDTVSTEKTSSDDRSGYSRPEYSQPADTRADTRQDAPGPDAAQNTPPTAAPPTATPPPPATSPASPPPSGAGPDDDVTRSIPTRPADTSGPRDAAGSSGYLGHRSVPGDPDQPRNP